MEPIFVHDREDRRQFGDLMPQRLGIVAGEGIAAPAALGRPALDDLADLLGRDQGADVTRMSGLAAPLLARGGGRRSSLQRGRVGGGRPGGVGGVPADPLLQLGDPTLDAIEGGGEGGLHIGRDTAPEGFGDRRYGTHVAGIRDGRHSSNSHPKTATRRLPKRVGAWGDLACIGIADWHPQGLGATPRRKPRGQARPEADRPFNRAFARRRIAVEHTIGRMRRYQALSQVDRHRRRGHTARVRAVAGLVNRMLDHRVAA